MTPHDSYTRLLGLALRGGNLVTGSDAVQSAVHAGKVRLLLLSADASPRTCRDAQQWSERGHCLCAVLPCDKAELGHALGSAAVAVAALTDTGLANAVGERLARFDPERYAYLSERLQRKVVRAGERRAARARARPDDTRRPRPKAPAKRQSGERPNIAKRQSGETSNAAKRGEHANVAKRQSGERPNAPKRGERPAPATKARPAVPPRRPRPKKTDT